MNTAYIAVDVGRSSVKCSASVSGEVVQFSFPSILAKDWNRHSSPKSSLITTLRSAVNGIHIDGDDTPIYLFGDSAEQVGEHPTRFGESAVFHEFAVSAILFSLTKVALSHQFTNCAVAICLTSNNTHTSDFYAERLKKTFTITDWQSRKRVTFTIQELYAFHQGYVSVFNFLSTPSVNDSPVLCIDVGKYTTDLCRVQNFSLTAARSENCGTSTVISAIQLIAAPVVHLSDQDIERGLLNHSTTISSSYGVALNPWKVYLDNQCGLKLYRIIKDAVIDFIDRSPVGGILLCGGGSLLLKDYFTADFHAPLLDLPDLVYANSSGMLKFLENS